MDKQKTILRLSSQIDTIKAHIVRLKKRNYEIHSLDIDMLRQKTYELYDLIHELDNPQSTNVEVVVEDVEIEEKQVTETIVEEEKIEKPKVEPKPIKNNEEASQVEEKEIESAKKEIVVEEPVKEEVVEIEIENVTQPAVENIPEPIIETVPEPIVETVPEPIVETLTSEELLPESITEDESHSAKQTTYDLFSGSGDNAIAEKFQSKDETSIAEKMQKSQFSNIREAIGINEKFLFINELFNGDMGRYNKILDDINELSTKQGVDTYLFELKIQFQWPEDGDAYIRLKELLDRKFG